jgi:hypothetical protein
LNAVRPEELRQSEPSRDRDGDGGCARPGALVYVSDAAGGGIPAFSDGADWRRVSDGAAVS